LHHKMLFSMLPDKVIAIYCFVDDLLTGLGHHTKEGCRTTDAEIITTALVSALVFKGNQCVAIDYMRSHNMTPRLPKKSGFTKRLHALCDLLLMIFQQVGHFIKRLHVGHRYLLDSFPLAVCHNIRIRRCKLLKGKEYRGWIPGKQQYFYGVRIQLITTEDGTPVEVCFVPGSANDAEAIGRLLWDFEPGDSIVEDSAYTHYLFEDMAREAGIDIQTIRKRNHKRKDEPWINYLKRCYRKRIETPFSGIVDFLPKALHCVTTQGFFLKALLFLMAYQFNKII
jgi:hypothetical protein